MRLLLSELHKVWGQRVFSLCLAVLTAANLFLLYVGTKPGDHSISAAAWRELSMDLVDLSTEEQQSFLAEKLNLISGVLQVEQMLTESAGDPVWAAQLRKEHTEVFDRYEEIYRKQNYRLYTDSLHKEFQLLNQVKAELDTVAAYPNFLQEVQAKADQLSGISIFQNHGGGYNQRNIDKTAEVYAGMGHVKIEYVPQKGLFTALDYQFTDMILLVAMLILASLLVRQERDNGMLQVVRSTPGGRLKTALAKLVVLASSMLVILLLLYGVNLAYCGLSFGLGPLSRSIQSVPALMRCTMQINVRQYLGRFLLAKWAGSFVMGLWVMLGMFCARRTITGWFLAIGLPFTQWLIRMVIPATSRINVIKYANISSLLRTNELLGGYRNLYWFGTPVGLPVVEWISALLYGVLFVCEFCLVFVRAQLKPASAIVGFSQKQMQTKATTIFLQEARKLFVLDGAMVILVCFIVYQGWSTAQPQTYFTEDGVYYAYYMKQLEGPYTRDTYDKLQAMQQEFEPIVDLQQAYYCHKITEESYYSQMAVYCGLLEKYQVLQEIVYGNLNYIKENPKAHLVYERGWEKIFNFYGDSDLQDAFWAGLLSCVCFAGLFAFEKKGGMQRVVMATPLGRRHTVVCKLLAGSIGAGAICLLTYIPRIIVVLRDYGLSQFFAPAMSLQQFHKLPDWILLGGILLWGFCGRLIACLSMMLVILWLSDRLGNALQTVLVSSLFLCLPPMLALSGMKNLRWVGVYPLFHLTEMAQRSVDSVAGVMCIVIALAISWLCSVDLLDRWEDP